MKILITRCYLTLLFNYRHAGSNKTQKKREWRKQSGKERVKVLAPKGCWEYGNYIFPRWSRTLSGNLLYRCHSGKWERREMFPSRPQQTPSSWRSVIAQRAWWWQLRKHFLTTMSDWAASCCSTEFNWSYIYGQRRGEDLGVRASQCSMSVCVCNSVTPGQRQQ